MSSDTATSQALAIHTQDLSKTYVLGLRLKKVHALSNVSLSVPKGSIFGFLGPNGAGKTTTIKMLTGLIKPSSGTATLFDVPVSTHKARSSLGYVPENPYFYDHLTPSEFLRYYGGLCGLNRNAIDARMDGLLTTVGLLYAKHRPMNRFSKGMRQRLGLAQAVIHEPRLLILDEPMSGLDPLGRKMVKDLIVDQSKRGATVFFSSHIISDIEDLCDHVAILARGTLVAQGSLHQLLNPVATSVDLTLLGLSPDKAKAIPGIQSLRTAGERITATLQEERVQDAIKKILESGGRIDAIIPHRENLEDYLVRMAGQSGGEPESAA